MILFVLKKWIDCYKIRKLIITSTLALSLIFNSNAALAAHEKKQNVKNPYFDNNGLYIEFNAGVNTTNISLFNNSTLEAFHGFGWNLNIGYQANRHIGAEINFIQFRKSNFSLEVVSLAAKGIWPFAKRYKIFAKLGPSYVIPENQGSNKNGIGLLYFAAGIAYALTTHVDFIIQYSGAAAGHISLGLLAAGFVFHFT